MAIWFNKSLKIGDLHTIAPDTMSEHLGMVWTELGDNYLKMKMPVDYCRWNTVCHRKFYMQLTGTVAEPTALCGIT